MQKSEFAGSFFEAYINGKKVSDDRYVPAWSDYEPRAGRRINYPIHDTFTHRVYYLEYTLDSCIADGENTVEVILGNGWYNQHEKIAEGDLWYGSPKLWYEIVSDGGENFCDIKFTWHGFRYFEIKGNAEDVKVYVIHSDVKLKCGFECDNKLLNRLFRAYVRSQLSNMHCGVPSDCPHRERLGYTGDGQMGQCGSYRSLFSL